MLYLQLMFYMGVIILDIKLENNIEVEDYNNLREKVGWRIKDSKVIKRALNNSSFMKKAIIDNETAGMARAISDGMYALIVDVIVSPEYQNKGIGKLLINALLKDLEDSIDVGEEISVNLVSMQGKEEFYEKCGFHKIPYDYTGYGMKKKIQK